MFDLDYDLEMMVENCIEEALVSPPRSVEHRQAIRALIKITDKSERTIRRYIFDYPPSMNPLRRKRTRSDWRKPRKFPAELQEKARKILAATPKITIAEIRRLLDNRVSKGTLHRWLYHNYTLSTKGHWLLIRKHSRPERG